MAERFCVLSADLTELGIVLNQEIIHPEFSSPPMRRSSFSGWPSAGRPDCRDLAQAGFFHSGFDDQVTCFSCNGSLVNWSSTDIPTNKHKLWFPTCQIPQLADRNIFRGPSCQQDVCSGIFQVQNHGGPLSCFLQGARPIELDVDNISTLNSLELPCLPTQQAFQGFYAAKEAIHAETRRSSDEDTEDDVCTGFVELPLSGDFSSEGKGILASFKTLVEMAKNKNDGFKGDATDLPLKRLIRITVLETEILKHIAFARQNIEPTDEKRVKNFVVEKEQTSSGEHDEDAYEDEAGHGTFWAGIAVGNCTDCIRPQEGTQKAHNRVIGVVPFAELLVGKVLRNNPKGNAQWQAGGIDSAVEQGEDIISISFSQTPFSSGLSMSVHKALVNGVIIVYCASNDGRTDSSTVVYPAKLGKVICVGSHGSHGESSKFSGFGREMDLLAPCERVQSAISSSDEAEIGKRHGNSMSTPYITGVCGLVMAYAELSGGPDLQRRVSNCMVVKSLLQHMVSQTGIHDQVIGYGSVDPSRFLKFSARHFRSRVNLICEETSENLMITLRKMHSRFREHDGLTGTDLTAVFETKPSIVLKDKPRLCFIGCQIPNEREDIVEKISSRLHRELYEYISRQLTEEMAEYKVFLTTAKTYLPPGSLGNVVDILHALESENLVIMGNYDTLIQIAKGANLDELEKEIIKKEAKIQEVMKKEGKPVSTMKGAPKWNSDQLHRQLYEYLGRELAKAMPEYRLFLAIARTCLPMGRLTLVNNNVVDILDSMESENWITIGNYQLLICILDDAKLCSLRAEIQQREIEIQKVMAREGKTVRQVEDIAESRRLHWKLYVELDWYLTPAMTEYRSFMTLARTYVPPGKLTANMENIVDVLRVLETEGKIGIGDYTVLLEILRGGNLRHLEHEIEKKAIEIQQTLEMEIVRDTVEEKNSNQLHRELYVYINRQLTEEMVEYKSFLTIAKTHLPSGSLSATNVVDILHALESENVVTMGNYDALIRIAKGANLDELEKEIRTKEAKIQEVMKKEGKPVSTMKVGSPQKSHGVQLGQLYECMSRPMTVFATRKYVDEKRIPNSIGTGNYRVLSKMYPRAGLSKQAGEITEKETAVQQVLVEEMAQDVLRRNRNCSSVILVPDSLTPTMKTKADILDSIGPEQFVNLHGDNEDRQTVDPKTELEDEDVYAHDESVGILICHERSQNSCDEYCYETQDIAVDGDYDTIPKVLFTDDDSGDDDDDHRHTDKMCWGHRRQEGNNSGTCMVDIHCDDSEQGKERSESKIIPESLLHAGCMQQQHIQEDRIAGPEILDRAQWINLRQQGEHASDELVASCMFLRPAHITWTISPAEELECTSQKNGADQPNSEAEVLDKRELLQCVQNDRYSIVDNDSLHESQACLNVCDLLLCGEIICTCTLSESASVSEEDEDEEVSCVPLLPEDPHSPFESDQDRSETEDFHSNRLNIEEGFPQERYHRGMFIPRIITYVMLFCFMLMSTPLLLMYMQFSEVTARKASRNLACMIPSRMSDADEVYTIYYPADMANSHMKCSYPNIWLFKLFTLAAIVMLTVLITAVLLSLFKREDVLSWNSATKVRGEDLKLQKFELHVNVGQEDKNIKIRDTCSFIHSHHNFFGKFFRRADMASLWLQNSCLLKPKQYMYIGEGYFPVSTLAYPLNGNGSLEDYFKRLVYGSPFTVQEQMKYEWARLHSFKSWPNWAQAFPSQLASAGFYHTRQADEAVCFSCGGSVVDWRSNMVPIAEHKVRFPFCKFITGVSSDNQPIPEETQVVSPNGDPFTTLKKPLPFGSSTSQKSSKSHAIEGGAQEISGALSFSGHHVSIPSYPVMVTDSGSSRQPQSHMAAVDSAQPSTFTERMKNEGSRHATFRSWPKPDVVSVRDLVKAGLYYTGNRDEVKCAFCNGTFGNFKSGDDPMVKHRSLFPHCSFARGNSADNQAFYPTPRTDQPRPHEPASTTLPQALLGGRSQTASEHTSTTNVDDWTQLGILSAKPKHPEYALLQSREESFHAWSPTHEQTPHDLAVAGFIYAGMGDCVKCFYCDGGLRNWLPGDLPWAEHARWFPNCVYVKLCKGQDFIDTVEQRYPRLPLGTTAGSAVTGSLTEEPAAATGTAASGKETVQDLLSTPACQSALDMGYGTEFVKRGLKKYLKDHAGSASGLTAQALMENLLEMEDHGEDRSSSADSGDETLSLPGKSQKKAAVLDESELGDEFDTKSLRDKNRELIEQTLCKICLEKKMCITFLPCGHLVSCENCAPALRKCPICRSNIKGRVRVYMS